MTLPYSAEQLAEIARARATDGSGPNAALARVVRMSQRQDVFASAETLGAIRPDLAGEDADPEVAKRARRRSLLRALIEPTGPRWRLSRHGIVKARIENDL